MKASGRMPRTGRILFRVRPMLATLVEKPFHAPNWVYEEKYDGYRILGYKEGENVTLFSRNAKERTESFADVARSVRALSSRTILLDGEVVAFDRKLVSRFQLLQQGKEPYVYAVFDCLFRDGRDLRTEPLTVRRAALEEVIGDSGGAGRLFASRRLARNGLAAYRMAKRKGFEGLIAKDSSAPYIEGRSARWLKVKVHREEEFVIGGFTAPAGTRAHFGALLMGGYAGGDLLYVGKVGTGFSQKVLADLHRRFQPVVQKTSPFVNPPPEKGATWIAPRYVAQVSFHEWTADRRLRQPVYLGLRDDKSPAECVLPGEWE